LREGDGVGAKLALIALAFLIFSAAGGAVWYAVNVALPFSLEEVRLVSVGPPGGLEALDEGMIWTLLSDLERDYFFLVDRAKLCEGLRARYPIRDASAVVGWRALEVRVEWRSPAFWVASGDRVLLVDREGFSWEDSPHRAKGLVELRGFGDALRDGGGPWLLGGRFWVGLVELVGIASELGLGEVKVVSMDERLGLVALEVEGGPVLQFTADQVASSAGDVLRAFLKTPSVARGDLERVDFSAEGVVVVRRRGR